MSKALVIIMVMMLSGCASVQSSRLTKGEQIKLDSTGSAYVLATPNAMYFKKECIGSGKAIVNLIQAAFSKHLKRVEIAPEGEKIDDGLKKAKDAGFTYLINSGITRWEDHPTEWTGQMDQIDLQMDIHDVQAGRIIDSVEFTGHGTWMTFGGYHPQNIVRYEIPEYVSSLFSVNVDKEIK